MLFGKWKQGRLELDARSKEWLKKLKKTSRRGVKIKRVSVVPLPLSDYMNYEIDFWKNSIKYGEILLLKTGEYRRIIKNMDFAPEDFWTFDDKILIIFRYDGKGDFVREEPISDKAAIKRSVGSLVFHSEHYRVYPCHLINGVVQSFPSDARVLVPSEREVPNTVGRGTVYGH